MHFMDNHAKLTKLRYHPVVRPGVGGFVGQADHHESHPGGGRDPGQFHQQLLGPAGAE